MLIEPDQRVVPSMLTISARNALIVFACCILAAWRTSAEPDEQPSSTPDKPQITLGDGARNWIVSEGLSFKGATFMFREVQIDGNGWLVLHPFRDGRPYGDIYVGSTFIQDGTNRDVEITVDEKPSPGTQFLVMLHRDVNENREFDFVFVDERNVLDKAVFEGTTMIGYPIVTP